MHSDATAVHRQPALIRCVPRAGGISSHVHACQRHGQVQNRTTVITCVAVPSCRGPGPGVRYDAAGTALDAQPASLSLQHSCCTSPTCTAVQELKSGQQRSSRKGHWHQTCGAAGQLSRGQVSPSVPRMPYQSPATMQIQLCISLAKPTCAPHMLAMPDPRCHQLSPATTLKILRAVTQPTCPLQVCVRQALCRACAQ